MRRTLALAGATVLALGFTGLAGPAAADPGGVVQAQPGDVVIIEAGIDLSDTATVNAVGGNYLELLNRTGSPIDLESFAVTGCSTTDNFPIITFPIAAEIPANGRVLLAANDYVGGPARDFAYDPTANLEFAGGGVDLVDDTSQLMGDAKWDNTDSVCSGFEETNLTPTSSLAMHYSVATGTWALGNPSPGS